MRVPHDPGVVADPNDPPVGRDDAELDRPAVVARGNLFDEGSQHEIPILLMENRLEESDLQPVVGRVAEDLLHPGAHVDGDTGRRAARVRQVRVDGQR